MLPGILNYQFLHLFLTLFLQKLKAAERPVIIVGSSLLSRSDGVGLSQIIGKISSQTRAQAGWKSLNVLQRTAGQVAAMDLGYHPGIVHLQDPRTLTTSLLPSLPFSSAQLAPLQDSSHWLMYGCYSCSVRTLLQSPVPLYTPTVWSCTSDHTVTMVRPQCVL